jgi:hypothetical protein
VAQASYPELISRRSYDTLTITTAPYKSYADEQEGRSILVWKKVQ